MRVKIRLKNLNDIHKVIEKRVVDTMRSKHTQKSVTDIFIEGIRDRKFKASNELRRHRKNYLELGNKTHKKYERPTINITFTGEQLDDLRRGSNLKISKQSAQYTIKHTKGLHKKYKTPKGKSEKGKPVPYKTISKRMEELSYGYLKIPHEKVVKKMIKYLKREIMNRFK